MTKAEDNKCIIAMGWSIRKALRAISSETEVSEMHNNCGIADLVVVRAILGETEVSAMRNNSGIANL